MVQFPQSLQTHTGGTPIYQFGDPAALAPPGPESLVLTPSREPLEQPRQHCGQAFPPVWVCRARGNKKRAYNKESSYCCALLGQRSRSPKWYEFDRFSKGFAGGRRSGESGPGGARAARSPKRYEFDRFSKGFAGGRRNGEISARRRHSRQITEMVRIY